MRKSVVLVGAVLVASAAAGGVPAKAADLYGGSLKDEPVYAPPAFSWTGFYFGGHAGYEWKDLDGSDPYAPYSFGGGLDGPLFFAPPFAAQTNESADGWLGGIQLGYNYQFGRGIVIGTEVSGSWGDVGGNGKCFSPDRALIATDNVPALGDTTREKLKCGVDQNWTVQWLNKVGVAFGGDNRMLAYAIGGLALTDISVARSHSITFSDASGLGAPSTYTTADRWSGSDTAVGVVFGAGFQYAFTNQWSLGVEWLHAEYASTDIGVSGKRSFKACDPDCVKTPIPGGGRTSISEQLGSDTVRAVLNFKFN